MDCSRCAEELTALIDGELPASEAALMQSHIGACPKCAGEYLSMREVAYLIHNHHRKVDLGAGTWKQVQARINQLPAPPKAGLLDITSLRRWSPAIATILAVFVLGLGIWGYYSHQESERGVRLYMSEYLRAREAQELKHRLSQRRDGAAGFEHFDMRGDENPFVVVSNTTQDNPFRR